MFRRRRTPRRSAKVPGVVGGVGESLVLIGFAPGRLGRRLAATLRVGMAGRFRRVVSYWKILSSQGTLTVFPVKRNRRFRGLAGQKQAGCCKFVDCGHPADDKDCTEDGVRM